MLRTTCAFVDGSAALSREETKREETGFVLPDVAQEVTKRHHRRTNRGTQTLEPATARAAVAATTTATALALQQRAAAMLPAPSAETALRPRCRQCGSRGSGWGSVDARACLDPPLSDCDRSSIFIFHKIAFALILTFRLFEQFCFTSLVV